MKNNLSLIGGKIITMDSERKIYSGLIIEDGRITALGESADMQAIAKDRGIPVLDLMGKTVLPGLHDCHVHVMGTGMNLIGLDLYDCRNIDDVLDLLRDAGREPGEGWIVGNRLDESRLAEKRPPNRFELDKVTDKRGIYLIDRGLHYTQVNTIALEKIGLSGNESGIIKDEDGVLTGRLHGPAGAIARSFYYDAMDDATREQAIKRTAEAAVAKGITTIHAMEGGPMFSDADIPVFMKVMDSLPVDIFLYWDTEEIEKAIAAGLPAVGTDLLSDGSIGSRTAAFFKPYADDPKSTGILYYEKDWMTNHIKKAIAADIQCGFHAIGSRGIATVLDCYEEAIAAAGTGTRRFRIEHFGFPRDEDIDRAGKLGVVISTQPAFTYLRGGPGSVYNDRVGDERDRKAYPLRRFLDAGIVVGGGSDSGVTPMDPLLGIHSAVNPPYEENAVSLLEAIEMFTCKGAYTAHEEAEKGSLEIGKIGDLSVLSEDLLQCSPDRIKDIEIYATIKNGNVVYEK